MVINLGVITDEVARINVFSTNTLVNIPKIELDVPASRPTNSLVSLYLAQGDIFDPVNPLPAVGLNFAGLDVSSKDEHRIRFACAVADLAGSIRVGQVRRLQAIGAVNAAVVAGFSYLPDGVSVGAVSVGKVGTSGTITAGNGMGEVRLLSSGNTLEGSISVLDGGVELFDIPNGDVGANGASASVQVSGAIRRLDINGALASSIVTAIDWPNSQTEYVEIGKLTGKLVLGEVAATPARPGVRVVNLSSGRIEATALLGAGSGPGVNTLYFDQGLTGTGTTTGVFADQIEGRIVCGGPLDRIVCDGDMTKSFIDIYGHVKEFIVHGNLTVNFIVMYDGGIDYLQVDGNFNAIDWDPNNNGVFRADNGIHALRIGGDSNNVWIVTPFINEMSVNRFAGNISSLRVPPLDGVASVGKLTARSYRGTAYIGGVTDWNISEYLQIDPFYSVFEDREFFFIEPSPNFIPDFTFHVGTTLSGDLRIRSASPAFNGLITANASLCILNAQQAVTNAQVQVGGTSVSPLPFYAPTSPSLGGGYLAVLPYGLYESMCTPINNSAGTDRITASSFNREGDDNCSVDQPIALHFYGPVLIFNPALPAAKVELMVHGVPYSDVSRRVNFRINPTNPRELLIEGKTGFPIPAGQYRVTNSTATNQALYCTPVAGVGNACLPGAAVSAFEYHFELLPDCVAPFCEPEPDPSQCPVLPTFLCDPIDFNNDGASFDPEDVDAFLSVYSEGPCIPATAICNDVDFNNDGSGVDPCDIDAFLLMMSEGPCTACGQ